MSIIKNEIKKVFTIKNILIVIIATAIMWNLRIYFEIKYFPNGHPMTELYNDAVCMLKNYGTEVDGEEFKDYKKLREERIKEANNYLSSNEEYIKHGLGNYEDFERMKPRDYKGDKYNYDPKKREELKNQIRFKDDIDIFWKIDAIDDNIEDYENRVFINDENINYYNTDQINKLLEMENRENSNSPINYVIVENYNALIVWINVLVVISVFIMISPIFIRDNQNKVNYLQYSSKVGRRIFNKKIISGLMSSIMIITLQLAILFIIYKQNNTYMFWDCNINSIFNFVYWYDITFGQYIILTVILTYIIGIVASVISMFVSSKVNTYISLIGVQVPILFVLFYIINNYRTGYIINVYHNKYFIYILYLGLIVISVGLLSIMIKREKKLDIK